MRIAVIGSGIGGLAAAIRLRERGHEVTVWEKNGKPGGKIASLRMGGCRFDTGPSLFTLPTLVEELFELCGENMQDSIPYHRLGTCCRYFFPDGGDFTFYDDPHRLRRELDEKRVLRPMSVATRLRHAKELYELGAPVFLFTDFHQLSNFNTPPYRRVAGHLRKFDFLRTMHGANRRDFSDPRMIRIFDRYATYNGSDPYRAPATLNMIAHLENNLGAYFPDRGIYSLVEGLYRLALRRGVTFRFGQEVEHILVEGKRTVGICTAAGEVACDAVVSDVDAGYLSERLVDRHPLAGRLRRSEPSLSALIFYWAVEGRYPSLDVHNILFSADYRREFRTLFGERTLPEDPTVYLFVSSKAVPGDAPVGFENWYAMVNAPADCGQPWSELIALTRQRVAKKIEGMLGIPIESRIRAERITSPLTIASETFSRGGSLYGASSNSVWSAFLRHPSSLGSIGGLYFVGGSVHPGGGIPLCLAGAKIVDRKIASEHE